MFGPYCILNKMIGQLQSKIYTSPLQITHAQDHHFGTSYLIWVKKNGLYQNMNRKGY